MRDESLPAFEVFLVEDVILALGNLRGTLAWLGQSGPAPCPDPQRAGLERLERQIERLEDRARSLCRQIRAGQQPKAAMPLQEPPITLENLLRDALGTEAPGLAFRTRRKAQP